jgi:hypothetical protein
MGFTAYGECKIAGLPARVSRRVTVTGFSHRIAPLRRGYFFGGVIRSPRTVLAIRVAKLIDGKRLLAGRFRFS